MILNQILLDGYQVYYISLILNVEMLEKKLWKKIKTQKGNKMRYFK